MAERRQARELEPALAGNALLSTATGIMTATRLRASRRPRAHAARWCQPRSPREARRRRGGFRAALGGASPFGSRPACGSTRRRTSRGWRIGSTVWYDARSGEWFAKAIHACPAARRHAPGLSVSRAGGLGVHLTLDLAGQARFGPDVEWLDVRSPGDIDYAVDPERSALFYAAIRRYWPALKDGALSPAYSGVRPKLQGPGQPASDFVLQGPGAHGAPGLMTLYRIEAPGLTASLAIAVEVAHRLEA